MHIAIKIIKNFIDYRKYYWVAIIKLIFYMLIIKIIGAELNK